MPQRPKKQKKPKQYHKPEWLDRNQEKPAFGRAVEQTWLQGLRDFQGEERSSVSLLLIVTGSWWNPWYLDHKKTEITWKKSSDMYHIPCFSPVTNRDSSASPSFRWCAENHQEQVSESKAVLDSLEKHGLRSDAICTQSCRTSTDKLSPHGLGPKVPKSNVTIKVQCRPMSSRRLTFFHKLVLNRFYPVLWHLFCLNTIYDSVEQATASNQEFL